MRLWSRVRLLYQAYVNINNRKKIDFHYINSLIYNNINKNRGTIMVMEDPSLCCRLKLSSYVTISLVVFFITYAYGVEFPVPGPIP